MKLKEGNQRRPSKAHNQPKEYWDEFDFLPLIYFINITELPKLKMKHNVRTGRGNRYKI